MKQFRSGRQLPMGMILLSAVSMAGLTGCRSDSKLLRWVNPETLVNLEARLDPNLTEDEREAIVGDAVRMGEVDLTARQGTPFSLIFGATDMSGVLRYLDERVNFIISRETTLESLLKATRYRDGRQLPDWMAASAKKSQAPAADDSAGDDAPGVIVATNPGGIFWMLRELAAPEAEIELRLGRLRVPFITPRVGLMQIGEGYVARTPKGELLLSSMERIGTLVHEGRHSDCTGGVDELDLRLFQMGIRPRNQGCLHLHAPCPPGHELEGLPACDAHAWGAYSVGAVFGMSVVSQCTDCSEEERQGAMMDAVDSLGRVLPIDDMLSGKLGLPDMSSSGVRRMQ